jgi:hypothetical protein
MGWAGSWATICCTERQIRERGGRAWAGFGQERKREIFSIPSFLFLILYFSKSLHRFEFTRGFKTSLSIINNIHRTSITLGELA